MVIVVLRYDQYFVASGGFLGPLESRWRIRAFVRPSFLLQDVRANYRLGGNVELTIFSFAFGRQLSRRTTNS